MTEDSPSTITSVKHTMIQVHTTQDTDFLLACSHLEQFEAIFEADVPESTKACMHYMYMHFMCWEGSDNHKNHENYDFSNHMITAYGCDFIPGKYELCFGLSQFSTPYRMVPLTLA